jgi:hypothetical protein
VKKSRSPSVQFEDVDYITVGKCLRAVKLAAQARQPLLTVSGRDMQDLDRHVLLVFGKTGTEAIPGLEHRALAAASQLIDKDVAIP